MTSLFVEDRVVTDFEVWHSVASDKLFVGVPLEALFNKNSDQNRQELAQSSGIT